MHDKIDSSQYDKRAEDKKVVAIITEVKVLTKQVELSFEGIKDKLEEGEKKFTDLYNKYNNCPGKNKIGSVIAELRSHRWGITLILGLLIGNFLLKAFMGD